MKKMKWNLQAYLLGLLLAFAGVAVTSCSEDDEDEGGNVNVTVEQLCGTWKWVSDQGWEQEHGGKKEPWKNELGDAGLSLTLNADGTAVEVWSSYGYSWNQTWSLQNGNTLVWDGDAWTITRFTGSQITIEYYEEDEYGTSWDQVVFQKVN